MFDDQVTASAWEAIFSIPETLHAEGPPDNNHHMLTSKCSIVTKVQIDDAATWIGNDDNDF